MILKEEPIKKALARKGMTPRDIESVCESVAYRAKNGKPISVKSAKKIADELGLDLSRIVRCEP